jgi:sulfate/thiosulfate transport system substrate-binding protein
MGRATLQRLLAALGAAALTASAAAGCGGTSHDDASASGGSGGSLSLVAYSTPKEAYEEIVPAFGKTEQGAGVTFDQSYGSSGEQARAVEGGLPADVVALSLAPDVDKLVEAQLVDEGWDQDEYDGFVTNSVVVLAVRKGNPKGIRGWDDLAREGVEVVTPNPFTSGGAKWNTMAAYGAKIEQGASPDEALDFVRRVYGNVKVFDKSAREALQTFIGGKGDVLIAYENEAITAQQKGEDVDFVTPDETILIQNPVAVVSESKGKRQAQAFIDFLRSAEAQKIYAAKGYRPVVEEHLDEKRYPTPSGLFKIDDLGGWSKVNDEFFDAESGKIGEVLRDQGVSTASG